LRLCTAFELPENTTYEEVLGFQPKYTVNVGKMKPPQFVFAYAVGMQKLWLEVDVKFESYGI
jgi:hypothetical protein